MKCIIILVKFTLVRTCSLMFSDFLMCADIFIGLIFILNKYSYLFFEHTYFKTQKNSLLVIKTR